MVIKPGAGILGKIGCGLGCLAAAALLVVIGPGLFFGLMLWGASERTIYSRETSPNGDREARVQFDDCGAPCGWTKIVFVKRAWIPSDTPLLSCRAFLGDGTNRVRVAWSGNSKLIVHHGFSAGEIADVVRSCGDVSIVTQFDPTLVSDEP
ncbi:hypothetical protein [Allosphingosinicella humi]|jgi:hypothetical protein